MKVFVTGATGFVGSYVLKELLANEHEVRLLVRPGSESKLGVPLDRVEVVHGDVTQPETLEGLLDGCDAVIHLVGILREDRAKGITFERVHLDGARNVINAAKAAGVKRFLLMSANGVKPRVRAVSAYQWTKYEAEEYLKTSGLDYVIFRPSVIFGKPAPGQPEFASQLARDLLQIPLIPLPLFREGATIAQLVKSLFPFVKKWQQDLTLRGSTFELQPVAVENVAEGFVKALDTKAATGQTYEVGGRRRFTWGEILDVLTYARGRRRPRWKAVVPVFFLRLLLANRFIAKRLPITEDQLDMLLEGNVCAEVPFYRDLAIKAIPFKPETVAYIGSGGHTSMSSASADVGVVAPRRNSRFVMRHYPVPEPNTGIGLAKFGMWVFLASEVMFFTGLIGAYIVLRNAAPSWPNPATRLNLGLTAVMTFILVMSSFTLVFGLSSLQRGKLARFKFWWALTILLGAAFVGLQAMEWTEFLQHNRPGTDMFWSVFYTLTGFHGAHVSIGVVALIYIMVQALRGKYTSAKHNTVEMTGLYWHFVDLVWIILFTIIYLV